MDDDFDEILDDDFPDDLDDQTEPMQPDPVDEEQSTNHVDLADEIALQHRTAEGILISTTFCHPENFPLIYGRLEPHHFSTELHQLAWAHIVTHYRQTGQVPEDIDCEIAIAADKENCIKRGDLIAVVEKYSNKSLIPGFTLDSYIKGVRRAWQHRYALREAKRLFLQLKDNQHNPSATSGLLREFANKAENLGSGHESERIDPLDLQIIPADHPSCLLGANRFFCRGDGMIISGPSSIGKSSFAIQAYCSMAIGRPFLGLKTSGLRPLKTLYVQSEDSAADISETIASFLDEEGPTSEQKELLRKNLVILREKELRGDRFLTWLEDQVRTHQPDIVSLNPLHAYIDGDISQSTDAGRFLREGLNRINRGDRFGIVLIHHTTKPPKEKKDITWNEAMYDMHGSAELTNWPRCIISLKVTEEEGEFDMIMAKRGKRAGIIGERRNEEDDTLETFTATKIPIAHSEGMVEVNGIRFPKVFWKASKTRSPSVLGQKDENREEDNGPKDKRGRPNKFDDEDILFAVPYGRENAIPKAKVYREVQAGPGIPDSSARRHLQRLIDEDKVCITEKRDVYRPGGIQ